MLEPWEQAPVDAGFAVNGGSVAVVPAQDGLSLDVGNAVVAITTAAHARGERAAGCGSVPRPPT